MRQLISGYLKVPLIFVVTDITSQMRVKPCTSDSLTQSHIYILLQNPKTPSILLRPLPYPTGNKTNNYLLFSLELIEACLCSFTIKMLKYSTANKVKNYLLFSIDRSGGVPKTPDIQYVVVRRYYLVLSFYVVLQWKFCNSQD